jgi:hypothetical protein
MSPITFTHQGIITQCELAKILIITSDGMVEVAFPLTDDDRRDMELHLHGKFAGYRAFQVKSTLHLAHRFRAYQLSMFFSVASEGSRAKVGLALGVSSRPGPPLAPPLCYGCQPSPIRRRRYGS